MAKKTEASPAPRSTDLDGWRLAIKDGRYRNFRLEEVVAAIQDLGLGTDSSVLNPLATHLSDALLKILRKYVYHDHPNKGEDIIWRTYEKIVGAVLSPESADGKGLREAFSSRVKYRLKDAIKDETREARVPTSSRMTSSLLASDTESQVVPPRPQSETSLFDPTASIDEWMDVAHILEHKIAHDQKRLAFRLYMDRVPFRSTKEASISSALGISEKTAREWVKEVREILSSAPEVLEILKSKMTKVMP